MTDAAKPSLFVAWDDERAREIVTQNSDRVGALMPILRELVDTFGYIDPEIVPFIARTLNLSRADVHGVITFYHDFRQEPPGKHIIQICRAESCQAMHADQLIDHAMDRLGVDWGGTTRDGKYTLEPVYCLGNCACSPAMMIDESLYGRVSPEQFDSLTGKQKGSSR